METVGLGFFFDDLSVGRRFKSIGRTITEADVINYISATGLLEVMFTDAEYQHNEAEIKGRVAPGMLAYSFAEGLLVQATMQHTALAFLQMEIKIHKPVFVGDTIHVEAEVVDARLSKSRPGRGIVSFRNVIVNQRGAIVQTYSPVRMVKLRGPSDDAAGRRL
jgi:acyl dehydratase